MPVERVPKPLFIVEKLSQQIWAIIAETTPTGKALMDNIDRKP